VRRWTRLLAAVPVGPGESVLFQPASVS